MVVYLIVIRNYSMEKREIRFPPTTPCQCRQPEIVEPVCSPVSVARESSLKLCKQKALLIRSYLLWFSIYIMLFFCSFWGTQFLILMKFYENRRLFVTPRVKLQGPMLVSRLGTLMYRDFTFILMSCYYLVLLLYYIMVWTIKFKSEFLYVSTLILQPMQSKGLGYLTISVLNVIIRLQHRLWLWNWYIFKGPRSFS